MNNHDFSGALVIYVLKVESMLERFMTDWSEGLGKGKKEYGIVLVILLA